MACPQQEPLHARGDIIPEGMEIKQKVSGVEGVDFWAEGKGRGRIVCTGVEVPEFSGSRGSVRTRNEWRTADGVKILTADEETAPTPPAEKAAAV